jgi:WD40 repeat protein
VAGHVFISHSLADRAYVHRLVSHLTAAGIPIWYDQFVETGQPLNSAAQRAIDECASCIAVLTPASTASEWVRQEITYAVQLGKPIHSLRLSSCRIPTVLFGLPFEDVRDGSMPTLAFVTMLLARTEPPYTGGGRPQAPAPGSTSTPPGSEGRLRQTLRGHTDAVSGVAIAPDNSWLASSSFDGTVRLWSADGSLLRTMYGHIGGATGVAIAPDGNWLASSGGQTVRVWGLDGRHRATLAGHSMAVWGVAISPNSAWIASAGIDRTVRVWASSGVPSTILTGHTDAVLAVSFAPTGDWLASGGADHSVRLWRANGHPVAVLNLPNVITGLAVAPDGDWLATCSGGTVRVWRSDGTDRSAFEETGNARSLAIAPDGAWIAGGCDDGSIQIWRTNDGMVTSLVGHTDVVETLAVATDGSWLASAGKDRTIRIWDISSQINLESARQWIGPGS